MLCRRSVSLLAGKLWIELKIDLGLTLFFTINTMSATTQAFFALDRIATEEVLIIAMKNMDDLTLKNAVYSFISSYRPWMLKDIIEDVVFKKLCNEPLKATTDARKLKELEDRFPGATIMLSMNDENYIIKYITDAEKNPEYDMICCHDLQLVTPSFSRFDVYGKFNLVAKWRGVDINLTHLF